MKHAEYEWHICVCMHIYIKGTQNANEVIAAYSKLCGTRANDEGGGL